MQKVAYAVISVYIAMLSGCQNDKLNEACRDYEKSFLKKNTWFVTDGMKHETFYSKRADSCIMTSVDIVANKFEIYDIKAKDRPAAGLFDCNNKGCDSVILDKMYGAGLKDLHTSEFLDNGEGGPSRTDKAPQQAYTREKCEQLFKKKISELK